MHIVNWNHATTNELWGAAAKRPALRPTLIWLNGTPVKRTGVHTRVIYRNKDQDRTRNESSWVWAEDGFHHPSHSPNNRRQGNETRLARIVLSDKAHTCRRDLSQYFYHIIINYGYNAQIGKNVTNSPLLYALIRGTLVWPQIWLIFLYLGKSAHARNLACRDT